MFFQERYNDFLWEKTKLNIYKEKFITFKGNWFFYDSKKKIYTIWWKEIYFNYNNQTLDNINFFSFLFFRNKWHIIFFKKKNNKELKLSVPYKDNKNFHWDCFFYVVEWFIYEFENFSWEPLFHIDAIFLLKSKEKETYFYQSENLYYLITNIIEKEWKYFFDLFINWTEFKNIELDNNFSTDTRLKSFSFLFSWKVNQLDFIKKNEIFTKEKLENNYHKYFNTFLHTIQNFSFHWLYYNYLENKLYNIDKIFNDCLENEEIKQFIEKMKWLKWQFSDKNIFYRDSLITDFHKDWIDVSFFLFFNHFFVWRDLNKLKNYLSSLYWVDITLICPKFTFDIDEEKVLWLVFQIDVKIQSDKLSVKKIYWKITTEKRYKNDLDCYVVNNTNDILLFNNEELYGTDFDKVNLFSREQLKIPNDYFFKKYSRKDDLYTKNFNVKTFFSIPFDNWNSNDFDKWSYFNNSTLLDKNESIYYYYDDKYIEFQKNYKIMFFIE